MQWLYRSRSENFVQNFDFFAQLQRNVAKTFRQLSDVSKRYFQISSKSLVVIWLKALYDGLEYKGIAVLVNFSDDLEFALQVNGTTH